MRRDPIKIVGIELDPEHLVLSSTGEWRQATLTILEDGESEKIRSGYYCAKCFDPQEEPFPEKCATCKFPMRDRQPEYFARNYQGDMHVDVGTSLDNELEFMEQWEKENDRRYQRDSILRPAQVILPRGI